MSGEPTLERIFGESEEEVIRLGCPAVVSLTALVVRTNVPRPAVIEENTDYFDATFHGGGDWMPIVLRSEDNPDEYLIVSGECRYYSALRDGVTELPVVVVTEEILDRVRPGVAEKVRSYALDAYEEALAYSRLICEYGMTAEELATTLGRSKSAVNNAVRLLGLPRDLIVLLREHRLSAGHCRALLALEDKARTLTMAEKIAGRNLSVREVENAVKTANRIYEAQREADLYYGEQTDYSLVEAAASARLGRNLKIQGGKRRSVLSIEFSGDDDLRGLLTLLCGEPLF